MLEAYIECALWSTLDYYEEDESGHWRNLDSQYGLEDIADSCLTQMHTDCKNFANDNADALAIYYDHLGYNEDQAGHDFWLTRERHGTGFWDRYYGDDVELSEAIRELTEAAHAYGEFGDELNEGILRENEETT